MTVCISRFASCLGVLSIMFFMQATAECETLSTEVGNGADAFVNSGSFANQNFGDSEHLAWKNSGVPGDFNRKSYVRFDTSSIGQVSDATLTFSISSISDSGFNPNTDHIANVFGLVDGHAGEAWDETTVTWNNAPANVTNSPNAFTRNAILLGTFSVSPSVALGEPIIFSSDELINFINSDTNDLLTLMVSGSNAIVHGTGFATKENSTFAAPMLEVVGIPEPSSAFILIGASSGFILRRRMV